MPLPFISTPPVTTPTVSARCILSFLPAQFQASPSVERLADCFLNLTKLIRSLALRLTDCSGKLQPETSPLKAVPFASDVNDKFIGSDLHRLVTVRLVAHQLRVRHFFLIFKDSSTHYHADRYGVTYKNHHVFQM
jgi:hypothetical protein